MLKTVKAKKLPLNLQFFSDPVPAEPSEDPTPNLEPPAVPEPIPNEPTPPAEPKKPEPSKTFSQEDVNGLVAKEAKKAQEKLLKQLGIDDFKNAKEGLQKFKEWQDSQKTEAEKQAERLKELETNYTSTAEENASLRAQISAMKAGVKSESVEDVVVLAKTLVNDEVDMDTAIKQVIEKYPQFAQEAVTTDPEPPKPTFTQGQHQTQPQTDAEKWASAFNFFNKK